MFVEPEVNTLLKKLTAFLLAVLAAWMLPAGALALEISCSACILIERDTGRVLYSENAQEKLPMASTTKIMTALLTIEHGDLNAVVEIPEEAEGVEGSSIYLQAGEHMTLKELLLGLMLHSGNDAAVAVAVHIAGSVEAFCALMNGRAQELGAANTHFVNPNGLPNDEHYTTAEDYAKIAAAAMKNPDFREIVSTASAVIPNEFQEWDRQLTNKNKLLSSYEGATGVKTGYTKAAGKCFVGSAEREGMELLTVVLHASDTYADTKALLDYGFAAYAPETAVQAGEVVGSIPIEKSTQKTLEVRAKDDIVVPLAEGEQAEVKVELAPKLAAPVAEGTAVGTVEVWVEGVCLAEQTLVCAQRIEPASVWDYLRALAKEWLDSGLFRSNGPVAKQMYGATVFGTAAVSKFS